MKEFWKSVKIW